MKPNTDIYILSQPIRTGKTTALMEAILHRNDIGGFLTPDVNGVRQIYHPGTNVYIPFEAQTDEATIEVGKFRFSKQAFEYGNAILKNSITRPEKYILVDESGKLELNNEGFHEGIQNILAYIQSHPGTYKLLLVVRASLLEEMIKHYRIEDATIIDTSGIETFLKA